MPRLHDIIESLYRLTIGKVKSLFSAPKAESVTSEQVADMICPTYSFDHKFKCDYCGQEYNEFQFQLAVFLRGLVLLEGKESFYVGINCINGKCCKLITHREDINLFGSFIDILTRCPEETPQEFVPRLTYHALSGDILDEHVSLKNWSGIEHSSHPNKGSGLSTDDLSILKEKYSEYYWTYLRDWQDVCGPMITPYYLTEEDIKRIIGLETGQDLRIFPRYINYNPVISDIESFVWTQHLFPKHQEAAGFSDRHKAKYPIKRPETHHSVADFMDILKNNPLPPYGKPDDRGAFEHLWKTDFPFHLHGIPEALAEIFKQQPVKDNDHMKMTKSVEKAYRDKRFHDYLEEAMPLFIDEYLVSVFHSEWNYATVWSLKEKYLIQALNKVGRSSTRDRISCRSIAKALWEVDPTLTIKEMIKKPEIQAIGQSYAGERTVHNWICDLAPEKHRKPGRPRIKK